MFNHRHICLRLSPFDHQSSAHLLLYNIVYIIYSKQALERNFAFRPVDGCQTTLLRLVEDCKMALDRNYFNSTYDTLLKKVNMPTLHLSRIKLQPKKCLKSPPYINDLIQLKISNYSFRHQKSVKIPSVKTVTYGKNSFRFEGAQIWNSLPNDICKVENYKEFGRLIQIWSGPSCKCAMCL